MERWRLPANASPVLKALVAKEAGVPIPSEQDPLSVKDTSTEPPKPPDESVVYNDHQYVANESKTYAGKYCCVIGCTNNQSRDIPRGVAFHKFPSNKERRQLWINAVNRVSKSDPKKKWKPAKHTVICSEHFYAHRKNNHPGSPSYVPSIFPTNHCKPKTKADEDRFMRLEKFRQMREQVRVISVASLVWLPDFGNIYHAFIIRLVYSVCI